LKKKKGQIMTAPQPRHQLDIFKDVIGSDSFKLCGVELSLREQDTIRQAFRILEKALRTPGAALTSPDLVADYLKLNIATRPHEVFVVLFLDNQHRVIETQEMFRGTIDGASVYPREVVKEALRLNAVAVILAHNHPSGIAEPSVADKQITAKVKDALALMDIRTLDHVIVGGMSHLSFAEHGLMP
jgi:DNA repair protein RadC